MKASFHLMRRQLPARLHWLNCGQVGERGMVVNSDNPCPSARRKCYSRKKVVLSTAVVAARAQATVLKTCVLSRTGKGRCDRAFRRVPFSRTPRFTCVSDGKPLRRLLVISNFDSSQF